MTQNNTYLAITIGPIYKTMTMARKTREFWGASLLISLLSKELCQAIRDNKIKNDDFLVPHSSIFSDTKKDIKDIGLYLDRIICKADEKIWPDIETNVIDVALDKLSTEIISVFADFKTMKVASLTEAELKGYLKNYFKIYTVFKEADVKHPLKELSEHLNTLELFNINDADSTTESVIKYFMENVNTEYDKNNKAVHNSFLVKYFSIKDFNCNIRIPSITEISTKPIANLKIAEDEDTYKTILNKNIWTDKPNEDKIFPALRKSYPNQIRNHFKYIAILQADGDKLGSFLLNSDENTVKNLSKALIDWCSGAALSDIKEYGALPIYIGGDDVMCFAPVNNGKETILDLACKLNKSFKNAVNDISVESTLSIGIKIAYYKSPMGESYEETFPLLRDKAKEYKLKKNKANACAINLEKHSGQPHELIFNFTEEYDILIKPLYEKMSTDSGKKSFISSVFYKIRANETLLSIIKDDEDRMWYFFDNNFDSEKDFLKAVCKYLFHLFARYGDDKIDDKQNELKATNYLYSTLKIIRFIKGLDYDNE